MNSAVDLQKTRIVPASSSPDDILDLRVYWGIIYRSKWGIIGLSFVVCVLTIVIVFAVTPVFKAVATLLIESESANVVSIEEVYGIDSSHDEYYQTQFEILSSRKLAERVALDLDIENHMEYAEDANNGLSLRSYVPFLPPKEPATADQKWQGTLASFRENLSISPVLNTQLVNISFESIDPELAPKVVNAIGNAYIESHLESRLELTQKASSWLTDRLGGMRGELEQAEGELRAYQEKENLVDVSGVQTLTAKELDELTRRLSDARKATTAAKSQFNAVGGSTTSNYRIGWETLPGVLQDILSQTLKQQQGSAENSFSELKKRYGRRHPKYIAAESQAGSARQSYRDRVQQIVEGFQEQYEQALEDEQQVERSISASKQEIQDINRKNYEMSQLQRTVKTNRQLYDMFFQRFQETNQTDFAAANARFVDLAVRPYQPVKPKKALIVALAGVLSVIIGVLLAFLRAALDNTIRVAEDLEQKLGQSVLGVVPLESQGKDLVVASLYMQKGHASFSEAIRSLRTSFVLAGIDKPHQITLVTSSIPGEGKTTISSNLALAMGQMERVLLIDADMRRPSLAGEYGFAQGTNGLAELVAGTASLEECIHHLDKFGIDLITAGAVPPNPLDLLSSKRFDALLTVLRDKYDRIVIDSAPTQAVSDSMVLSTKADALIYVIKSDSTPAKFAENGLQRLSKVGAPIIGMVLNQFDAKAAAKYGGYGGYGYYGYGYASKSYD